MNKEYSRVVELGRWDSGENCRLKFGASDLLNGKLTVELVRSDEPMNVFL
jgi:hypothetical protein